MSSANLVQTSYFSQAAFLNDVPSTPAFKIARITSMGIKQNTRTARSAEIRSDRQTSAVKRVGTDAGGPVNIELPYGAHDDMLAAALGSSGWSSVITVGASTGISFSSVDNSINGSSLFGSLLAGQWIKVSGATNAANNGYFKIRTKSSSSKIICDYGSAGTFVTETAGASITIKMGAQIVNGTHQQLFMWERLYEDGSLTRDWNQFLNNWNLNIAVEQMITGSFQFIGGKQESIEFEGENNPITDATYAAAGTTEPMAATDEVMWVGEGRDTASNLTYPDITNLSIGVNNNGRLRNVVGRRGPKSIGMGSIIPSGSLTVYHDDQYQLKEYLDYLPTSLRTCVKDGAGNAYVIELPNVRWTDGDAPLQGINTDNMLTRSWEAIMDPTESVTIRIAKFV